MTRHFKCTSLCLWSYGSYSSLFGHARPRFKTCWLKLFYFLKKIEPNGLNFFKKNKAKLNLNYIHIADATMHYSSQVIIKCENFPSISFKDCCIFVCFWLQNISFIIILIIDIAIIHKFSTEHFNAILTKKLYPFFSWNRIIL